MMNSPFYRNNNYSKSSSVPAKKVVSVPVHFISSDEPPTLMTRDSAALKIQRVLRGFLVRKSVKKISSVRNEIVNIEQRIINNKEFVNSIRDDPKERLRVNETLMSLLLKLDSIRGFDCGVRDFRKSVTKKAIAVQERVDSIDSNECSDVLKEEEEDPGDEIVGKEEEEEEEEGDCVVGSSMEVQKDDDKEEEEEKENSKLVICDKNDDRKMMKLMMMQMSERNEMQTRMINSLSRRVEQLEKAFLIHRLTRRNKKTASSSRRRRSRRIRHDDDER